MNDLIDVLLWPTLLASLALTVAGLVTRSWEHLLAAAVLSLVFSLISLGIGPLTLLLTDLQLAGAVALRWSTSGRLRVALLLMGALAWALFLLIPLPIGPASRWLPVLGLIVPLAGIIMSVVGPRRSPGPPTAHTG